MESHLGWMLEHICDTYIDPLIVLMTVSFKDYCMEIHWDIMTVKCMDFMKVSKWDVMMVK